MRDEQGFEQYVMARWASFHRLALLLTASETAAQDLVQVTLEKAYVAWPKIAATGIARRLRAPDHGQHAGVHAPAARGTGTRWRPPTAGARRADRPRTSVLDHALLWPMVCALPTRQRAVVVLRYYEDLSEQDIADVLGCAVGTVKSTAHDAMTALRRGIAAVPVTEGSDR